MFPVYNYLVTINRFSRYFRRYSREPLFDNEALRNKVFFGRIVD
jgi:hypothetical protein